MSAAPTPLVIVTGPPASGKTGLARRLAADLRLPLISRDAFKERIFDVLGWRDRAWSHQVGRASFELLWQTLEGELAVGRSIVVESNFAPSLSAGDFRQLAARYPFAPIQIYCGASDEVLLARHRERATSGERHPGHVDHLNEDEFRESLTADRYRPLDIGGELLEVDTSDFEALDYPALLARVRRALAQAARGPAGAPLYLDRLDHLVLTVRDIAATRDWYARVLGMASLDFGEGRAAVAFGEQKINLHQSGAESSPGAARPTPGSGDLCILTATPIAAVLAHLAARGVPVEQGPVARTGAQGPLQSIYIRDPNGNLIEIANQVGDTEP